MIDDGLVAASDLKELEELIADLKREFKIICKDVNSFLRLEIKRDDSGIQVNQECLAKQFLYRFNFTDCRPVSSPMVISKENFEPGKEQAEGPQFPYRQAVAAIVYLMLATRPDLGIITNGFLSRSL